MVSAKETPFLSIADINNRDRVKLLAAFESVLDSGRFILGQRVRAFEEEFAAYCGTRYCVGVGNGLDALVLIFRACRELNLLKAGDEVIIPANTFIASFLAASASGLVPVPVEPDLETYCVDPARIEESLTERTKAILAVHLYGQVAEMERIHQIARDRRLIVVEDAAQALGAEYKPAAESEGRRAGQMGDVGCFSFYPTKNLGAFGDAGMVVTENPALAEKVRLLRVHGSQPKYFHKWIGINSRLDTLQAAILLVKFKYLETWTEERRKKAKRYQLLFQDLPSSINGLKLPTTQYQNRHIFHQYVIRVPERDRLKQYLAEEEIGTDIYYPVPLHLQECYSFLKYRKGDLPVSEKASDEVLALPIYPELTEDQQMMVADRIKAFYKKR